MFTAVIDEDKCIGCSRCIPACPIDAIVGTSKKMHTVLTSECIGCKLCLTPCPMDCIDIVDLTEQAQKVTPKVDTSKQTLADNAKLKHKNRQMRINKKALPPYSSIEEKKSFIKNDLDRIKRKKNSFQTTF